MSQHYSYKGMSKTAQREASQRSQENEYYNRQPATGAFDFLGEDESVNVKKSADGGLILGTGEKAQAFGALMKTKHAGTVVIEDGQFVYYDDCICQMQPAMINEIVAETFYI